VCPDDEDKAQQARHMGTHIVAIVHQLSHSSGLAVLIVWLDGVAWVRNQADAMGKR